MKNKTDAVAICLSQMTAKEGREAQLQKALQALIEPSRQEPGCLTYELWQDLKTPRSFIMYERFQNREALARHTEMPYIQSFIENEYLSCVESHWDLDLNLI
jgi:quinol monooxygenase YgiN